MRQYCHWRVAIIAMGFIFSCGIARGADPAKATVKRSGSEIVLGNASIELVIDARPPCAAAVRLVNKLSGRTIPIRSDDFSIGLEGRARSAPAISSSRRPATRPVPAESG